MALNPFALFRKNPPAPLRDIGDQSVAAERRRRVWSVFLSANFSVTAFTTFCRLTLSVVKKPIVDSGILDVAELGIIGSTLFFAYAIGKLVNGILADRVNVRVFHGNWIVSYRLVPMSCWAFQQRSGRLSCFGV